jgi:hypothetical protein
MYEINKGAPSLTPDIIDKQDGLNVTWTNMRRNDDLSGFRSIVTLNADDPVTVDESGKETLVEWTLAPDIVVNLYGAPKEMAKDANGNDVVVDRFTPSLEVIDPVDPSYFLKAIDAWRLSIAAGFDQAFALSERKAVSGESKREDREAFNNRVSADSVYVVDAAVWLLESAAGYAADIIDQGDKYRTISFSPKFYLDIPQGDLDTFIALVPAYKDNLVSLDALLETSPVVRDVAEEKKKLEEQAKELEAAEVQRRKDALELARSRQAELVGETL